MVDQLPKRLILLGLVSLSCIVLAILAFGNQVQLTLVGLVIIGLSYGAFIAVFPAAVVKFYGFEVAPKMYGRIFTAWGVAGLCGPWLAGFMFDVFGNYIFALGLASVLALLSMLSLFLLPDQ